jgi:hypothetical protein
LAPKKDERKKTPVITNDTIEVKKIERERNIFVSKSKLTNSQIIDTRPGMQVLGRIMLIQCMMCDE